jgi:hypothetical protein
MGLIKSNKQLYWGAGLALVGLVSVFALVRSCADEKEQSEEAAEVAQALKGEDIVLAYVGDKREPVTAYDVDFASKQTLGKLADVVLEGKARFQVAESIIASKSIAQLREAEMSAAELAELEKHVQAHRERLLVKAYLAKHAKPETISEEEMQAYYKENPTKFGARDERKFEMVFVDLGADRGLQAELLQGLASVAASEDWRKAVAEKQSDGLLFGFREGDVELASLPAELRTAALKLQAKERTNVINQGRKSYVLRVNAINRLEAKPFAEVKDKIAKILEPRATKRQVESIQAQATSQVKVERTPALKRE